MTVCAVKGDPCPYDATYDRYARTSDTTDSKSIDFFYMFLGIFDIPSVKNLFWMSKILIMIFTVGTCRYSP